MHKKYTKNLACLRGFTMTVYPAQIDTNITLPQVDNLTPVDALVYNRLQIATIAVEQELGVKPSGVYSTVRARLDGFETIISNLNVISLAGDLGGSISTPLVIGLQGRPLSNSIPNFNDVIMWDGISWKPSAGVPGPEGPQGPPGEAVAHNLLPGLQGGNAIDGYYHFTNSQHNWLLDGYTDGYWVATKGGTGQNTYIVGDILYASEENTLNKLGIGDEGFVLTVSSGMPDWKVASGGLPSSALQYQHLVYDGSNWVVENGITVVRNEYIGVSICPGLETSGSWANGGKLTINSGDASVNGFGGDLTIRGGNSILLAGRLSSFDGGEVTIVGGNAAGTVDGYAEGGRVTINGGSGYGNGNGGDIYLLPGSDGGYIGSPGNIYFGSNTEDSVDTDYQIFANTFESNKAGYRFNKIINGWQLRRDGYSSWEDVVSGINFKDYNIGDMLYASAANTLAKRAIGTTGQVLTVAGGIPIWETPTIPTTVDLDIEKAVSMGYTNNYGASITSIVSPITNAAVGPGGQGGIRDLAYLGNGQIIGAFNASSAYYSGNTIIFKSYDYGKTWVQKTITASAVSWVSAVCYAGNGLCLAGETHAKTIIYSTNYGETWTRSVSSVQYSIFKILKCKNNILLAFTDNTYGTCTIYRSTDYGVTWTSVFTYANDSISNEAVIYCSDGYIIASADVSGLTNGIRSTDNGLTWDRISIDTGWNDVVSYSWIRTAITYCGNGICVAAANQNNNLYIARSTDYGATWTRSVNKFFPMNQLIYLGNGRIIGFYSYSKNNYYESLDYGLTWNVNTVGSNDLIDRAQSYCYLDNGTLLAGDSGGYLYTIPLGPTKPILAEQVGGTNQTSYATGDMLYASAANTLAKRTIGSAGQVLTVSGGIPTWGGPGSRKSNWWNCGVTPTSTAPSTSSVTITGLIVKPGDPVRILDKSGVVYSNNFPRINSTAIIGVTGNILDYRGCLYFKSKTSADPTFYFDVYSDELCTTLVATTTTFDASANNTYTLTLSGGLTGTISVSSITESRTVNFVHRVSMMHTGICTAYDGTTLTFAGQAISVTAGNILEVWLGNPNLVVQYPIDIAGSYATATTSTAFQDRQLRTPYWDQSNAILCMVKARNTTNDTGATQAAIAMVINGNLVVATDGSALLLNTARVATVVEMISNLQEINFGDSLEMRVIAGTNSNSQDLQGSAIFVIA